MDIGSSNIQALCQTLLQAAHEVADAYQGAPDPAPTEVVTPDLLAQAITQYAQILERLEADFATGATPASGAPADITQLADYGLDLVSDLSQWATQLRLPVTKQHLDALAVPIALWAVRRGGQLNNIERVVNALAVAANAGDDAQQLAQLVPIMGELAAGAATGVRQDLDQSNPARPWRILHLNRAIVATRTHDPALMREAFDDLVRQLPVDAAGFFDEGMRQMDALDYPAPVREVMHEYHARYHAGSALH